MFEQTILGKKIRSCALFAKRIGAGSFWTMCFRKQKEFINPHEHYSWDKKEIVEDSELKVLLVEDDEVDRMAFKRALRRQDISFPVVTARDGVEALEILRGKSGKAKLKRPFFIVLDINMPRMNGIEFLEELRSDIALRNSVVFVLTTSDDHRDKVAAYKKNITGYILKSKAGENFENLAILLSLYWHYTELPPECH